MDSDGLTWADIEADCGDYREGFVYVFLKYQGQRVEGVRLTQTAFANHFDIKASTFQGWVKSSLNRTNTVRTNTEVTPIITARDRAEEDEHPIERARELARAHPDLSYRQIGPMVGIDESAVRRDPVIRGIRGDSKVKDDANSVACRIETPGELIGNIKLDIARLFNSAIYSPLSEIDRRRLRKILNEGLRMVEDQEKEQGDASTGES
jgi:hypothetical protein